MGDGHLFRQDLGGLGLSRSCHRPLLMARRRLVHPRPLRTELVSEALVMAIGRRVPGPALLHHSDEGSQLGFKWSSQRAFGCSSPTASSKAFSPLSDEISCIADRAHARRGDSKPSQVDRLLQPTASSLLSWLPIARGVRSNLRSQETGLSGPEHLVTVSTRTGSDQTFDLPRVTDPTRTTLRGPRGWTARVPMVFRMFMRKAGFAVLHR